MHNLRAAELRERADTDRNFASWMRHNLFECFEDPRFTEVEPRSIRTAIAALYDNADQYDRVARAAEAVEQHAAIGCVHIGMSVFDCDTGRFLPAVYSFDDPAEAVAFATQSEAAADGPTRWGVISPDEAEEIRAGQ